MEWSAHKSANIALNGIEDVHQSVRYADDMVYILKPKDDAEQILERISQFLALRGLKVSEKKTVRSKAYRRATAVKLAGANRYDRSV